MAKDLVYVFSKIGGRSSVLGEIQSDFNMSHVIDGTKDSTTIIVWSYSDVEIEPWSIVLHKKTMTWWCVSHDKVERYQNDDGSFVWLHNLELNGAIELLNARDLTDCGFNDNTYTVGDVIQRLFSLSNAEYSLTINAQTNFLNQNVDFIKTFENYTLLSALREFLDAYNMCPKLEFTYTYAVLLNRYTLTGFKLNIIPKTGNRSRVHQMDDFDDVRETKTIDKNSFGTTVISNAENVISSSHKTYPATGSVKLGSTQNLIVNGVHINDCVIRLPSKVYKGNWIKIVYQLDVTLSIQDDSTYPYTFSYKRTQASYTEMISYFYQKVLERTQNQETANMFLTYMTPQIKDILDMISVVTLYDGNNVDAFTGDIIQGTNVPYLAELSFNGTIKSVIFTDKNTRECLKDKNQGIAWERGSNLITGFDMFDGSALLSVQRDDYQGNHLLIDFSNAGTTIKLRAGGQVLKNVYSGSPSLASQLKNISFIVDYIPMSDIKIKVDNQRDKRDIQLYNQNGKLTDSVALSKLLNSYSKEISSDTITKYMHYYSYSDVPQVGDIVMDDDVEYVVNNVSIDFTQNETSVANDFGYFLECEITMSKYVSTKSLMVNPNTNIRDYGIPQNYNIKRKQLYRDYYELGYTINLDTSVEPYLATNRIFNFSHYPSEYIDFVGVIKLGYDDYVAGYEYWYYQLETTTYYINKMLYAILDFQDNNIIGYGSQNVFSGFVISRIFDGLTDTINTPITYTDENGKVKEIDLLLCTDQQITDIYDQYQSEQVGGDSYTGILYNYSVFIPEDIYLMALDNYSIRINEEDYNKDATEVPVFEYVCQIGDSEDVLIGDNILKQYSSDFVYFYSYVNGDNINQNNAFTTTRVYYENDNAVYRIEFACDIAFENNTLKLSIWENCRYSPSAEYWQLNNRQNWRKGQDYAIFRHAYNISTGEEIIDLMFIAKNVQKEDNTDLVLNINYYKLK